MLLKQKQIMPTGNKLIFTSFSTIYLQGFVVYENSYSLKKIKELRCSFRITNAIYYVYLISFKILSSSFQIMKLRNS